MVTLHIANKNYSSWSLRPWVLMKALSIPFEEVMNPFKEGSNWNEFRTFSPTGLVPCLVDGSNAIWDSLGITEYIAEKYPQVWPAEHGARAWARCATAEMHSGFSALRDQCPMNCGIRVDMSEVSAALQRDINRLDELWNEGLDNFGGPFLAGSAFTAVDAFYAPVVFRAKTYGLPMTPVSLAYVEHLLSIEAMQSWYEAALLESWREKAQEQEASLYGTVREDFRQP